MNKQWIKMTKGYILLRHYFLAITINCFKKSIFPEMQARLKEAGGTGYIVGK